MREYRNLKSNDSISIVNETMKFSLGGINCSNCCKKIEKALAKMRGIVKCNASAMTYQLIVEVSQSIDPE